MNQKINYSKENCLVPVIVQNFQSHEVLMLGYMNEEAYLRTRQTGWVHFYSRSQKKLWMKGETSGNKLKVKHVLIDCDNDTLLIQAQLIGLATCHKGTKTCFHTIL